MNTQDGRTVPASEATVVRPTRRRGGSPAAYAAEIRTALDRRDELTALHVLGPALRWTTDMLRGDAAATPATAFRAVAMADLALEPTAALSAALSSLMDKGEPAAEVAADLRRHAAQLEELGRRLAPRRQRLAELRQAEERLRSEIAQQEEITAQIAELERVKRLAAKLTALQTQRDLLAERTRTMAGAVAGAEDELGQQARPLITLTQEVLGHLQEQTRTLLLRVGQEDSVFQATVAEYRQAAERAAAEAARHHAELAETEEAASRAQAQYEKERTRAADRLAALRRYQAANRDVAEALADRTDPAGEHDVSASEPADPVARALRALDEVQARLEEIDTLLGTALSPGRE